MFQLEFDPRDVLDEVGGDVFSWGLGSIVDAVADVGGDVVGGAVSVVSDVADSVGGAVRDVSEAAADFADDAVSHVGSWGSSFIDGVTHVATSTATAAWDLAGEGWDAARYVGARGVEMIGAGAAHVGPAVSFVGDVADTVTFGVGDDVLNAIDDTVLDTLDEITDGAIDIDYDDGGFTADVGIDDVIGVSLSIGEDGISTESEVIGGNLGMGLGDDGLLLDVEGGVDQFPLPYVDTHIEVDPEGNVVANGTVQGPVPYPIGDGIVAGRVWGGFERSEEGWAVETETNATYFKSDGTRISGGSGIAYAENESGSAFSAHVEGSVRNEYGEVGGGAGYSRIEQDGEVLETFEAEGHAKGFGMEASAETKYLGIETEEGSISHWETDVDFEGLDADSLMALGAQVLESSDILPDSVDGLVGRLGSGGTSSLMENLDQQGLGRMVAGLGGDGAADLVNKLGDDGTAGQFVEQLSPEAAAALVTKVADTGGVADLVEGLDAQQTAALIARLAAAQAGGGVPPGGAAPGGDDLLGVESALDEVSAAVPDAAGVVDEALEFDAGGASVPSFEDPVVVEDPGVADVVPAYEEPAPVEPEPSEFEETIDAADALEDSMDDLFEGLD